MIEINNKYDINDTIYWVALINNQWRVCTGRIARYTFQRWATMGDTHYYDVVAVQPTGVWGSDSVVLTNSAFSTKYKKNAVRKAKQENTKLKEKRK